MWCPSPGSTANLRAKKMTPRGCAAGFCADARNHKARHSRLWNKNNKNKKDHRRNEAPLCADRRADALPPTKAFRRRSAKLQSRPQSSWCKDADAAKLWNLSNSNSGRALILWYTIRSKQEEKGMQTAALSVRHTRNTQTLAAPRALRFRSASPERLTASHLC